MNDPTGALQTFCKAKEKFRDLLHKGSLDDGTAPKEVLEETIKSCWVTKD